MHIVAEAKKPFVPSIDRDKLAAVLATVVVGEVVTFETLTAAIGRDVRACRWLLDGARRTAEKEPHLALFDPVRGVGLRRLPNEERPGASIHRSIGRSRREVLRGRRKARTVEYAALSDTARMAFNMGLSVAGAMLLMTKPSRMKELPPAEKRFDPTETMRLLLERKKK